MTCRLLLAIEWARRAKVSATCLTGSMRNACWLQQRRLASAVRRSGARSTTRMNASCSIDRSVRTRAWRFHWARRKCGWMRRNSWSARRPGCLIMNNPVVRKPIWRNGWPRMQPSRRPIRPCRLTVGLAMPRNTMSSATGVRRGSCGLRRYRRR